MVKRLLIILSLIIVATVSQANDVQMPGANGAGRPPAYLSNPAFPTCKPLCLVNSGSYTSLDMDCLNDCMDLVSAGTDLFNDL